MLTRRENLLIRPWQERRYIHHREKIKYASPAIDNTPPPERPHVSCKLKKIQKEAERCSQIVNDNFTLLQHLSNIMRTTRVDHFWDEPPPNFLQRVGIYKVKSRLQKKIKFETSDEERPATRKERCYGCSPDRFHKVEIIPEERIPFAPPKKRVTRKAETPPDWGTQYKFRCAEDRPEFRGKIWKKPERRGSIRQKDGEKRRNRRKQKQELMEQSQCIYLSKGGLTLAVKFPSRSEVLMSNQRGTRVLQRELCECKSFPRKLSRLRKSSAETIILKSSDKSILDSSEKEVEDKTMNSLSKEFSNLKVTKEAEQTEEKSVISDGSYFFTNNELENVEYEDSQFKIEEERKQEEMESEREELAKEYLEEEELEQDEIDEEEVKQEADVEEEVEQEADVEEEVQQETDVEEEVEQETDVEEEVEQETDVEEEVEQEQVIEEEVLEEEAEENEHSDKELEDTDMNNSEDKSLLTTANENKDIIKLNASERKNSEEENNIRKEEDENSSDIELKKLDDQTAEENKYTKGESIETAEGNEALIDFNENSKRGLLVRFPQNRQLIEEEEENSFTDNQVKSDKSTNDHDKGNVVETEIGEHYVSDETKESISIEDEYTEEPNAINETGMKDTFSETENEIFLRGITFDTSQELIMDELIEHNEDEVAGEVKKSDNENSSKESIDKKIEKELEDAENVISELNKDDWLEDIEAMNNDDKLTDKK
ncbi:hypothetical protein O3M35_005269 [Rhynocoris fuscipes]|uniref:Uncharacterized protein n=1 Tax=Rhynocoris fuscipes TaxID=488301 RepID=A0AAW1DI38_9HEMI